MIGSFIALHHRTDPRFRCLRDDARLELERGSGMSALPSGKEENRGTNSEDQHGKNAGHHVEHHRRLAKTR